MLKVGIVGGQPLRLRTDRTAHPFGELAFKLILFVAPTSCGDHPSRISRLNVARMDFMRRRNCASGHINIQFIVLYVQAMHCPVEILTPRARISIAALFETSPQHILSDLGGRAVRGVEGGEGFHP